MPKSQRKLEKDVRCVSRAVETGQTEGERRASARVGINNNNLFVCQADNKKEGVVNRSQWLTPMRSSLKLLVGVDKRSVEGKEGSKWRRVSQLRV